MQQLVKILGGLILAIAVVVFGLARIAFEIIGASTAPDDFALLKARMPKLLGWLFTTPWVVPTLILVALCALAAWLLWSGTRKTAQTVATGRVWDEKQLRELIRNELAAVTPTTMVAADSDDAERGQQRGIDLSEDESREVKAALLRFSQFLSGPVDKLRRDAGWLGSAGSKLQHKLDDLPTLRDRCDAMELEAGEMIRRDRYAYELAGVNFDDLPAAINQFQNGIQNFWSKARHIEPMKDMHAADSVFNELREPAIKGRAALEETFQSIERRIADTRGRLP